MVEREDNKMAFRCDDSGANFYKIESLGFGKAEIADKQQQTMKLRENIP